MNKLFEVRAGSNLFGTNTESSDLDLKGIYIPTAKEICLNSYKKTLNISRTKAANEKNSKDDIDIEIFSLDRYTALLAEGQTCALEMLFAPMSMYTYVDREEYYIFSNLYNNRDKFLHKNISPIIGYAYQQANKYSLKGFRVDAFQSTLEFLSQFEGHKTLNDESIKPKLLKFVYERPCHDPREKTPYISMENKSDSKGLVQEYLQVAGKYYQLNCPLKIIKQQIQQKYDDYGTRAKLAKENKNIDYKALSHCLRVINQGIELLNTKHLEFPRPDRNLLLKIKMGEFEYPQMEEMILQGFDNLKIAQEKSTLREAPDQEWIDNYIFEVYSQIVKDSN